MITGALAVNNLPVKHQDQLTAQEANNITGDQYEQGAAQQQLSDENTSIEFEAGSAVVMLGVGTALALLNGRRPRQITQPDVQQPAIQ